MIVDPISSMDKAVSVSLNTANANRTSFTDVLQNEIVTTDNKIQQAEKLTQLYAVGEIDNLHQVMIAVSKAQTSFELVAQMRNRLVESVQEMMRMSV